MWDVIIIGAGFSGLAMASRLQRLGRYRFLVLEKSARIGGTWRDNRYPGCASDVPSHLYSLSFAPHPDWPQRYATHQQILDYLTSVSQPLGSHIRFHAEVQECRFDERGHHWVLRLADRTELLCRVVVAGLGPLNRPLVPDLPGRGTFQGRQFHTMEWPEGLDLRHSRVALVGTGASAIQVVPNIVNQVQELTVFQRHAPWIVPKGDAAYSGWLRAGFRHVPGLRRAYRCGLYLSHEIRALAFLNPALMRWVEKRSLRFLESSVRDPALRRSLVPDYPMGCKRILLSDDYYPALQQPHVQLVTDPIASIGPEGLHTRTGRAIAADVIVWATGYRHAETPPVPHIIGIGGLTLAACWQSRRSAYLGMAVAGFPNFFLLVGPNSGLGHNSLVFMMEAQVHWITRMLSWLNKQPTGSAQLSRTAYQAFEKEMERRSNLTVWSTGCQSWYLDAQGYNTALWPGSSLAFWRRCRNLKRADFELL